MEYERGVHMMKRMSRLVSVLLVLAMLCAMVPAVLAKDQGILPEKEITELWVGDTFSMPVGSGCTGKTTVTCTKSDGTSLGYNDGDYIRVKDGKYTANKTTISTNNSIPNNYIIATVSGNEAGVNKICEHAKQYYLKIYNKATGFSVKPTSVVVTKNQTAYADVTLSPVTAKNDVKCLEDPNGVAKATYDPATRRVKIEYLKEGRSDLTLVADYGTDHEKYAYITVSTSANAVVSIKKGSSVVAETGKDGEETVSVGAKMTLTATVSGATGTSNDVTWTSSSPDVVYVSRTGAVEALKTGTSDVVATSKDTHATAKYTIHVIDEIKSITLKEGTKEITSKEVNVGDKAVTITAETDPKGSESSVKWSVTDADILSIKDSAGYDSNTKTVTGASVTVTPGKAGKATLTATVGGRSRSVSFTVWDEQKLIGNYVDRADYTIRDGSNLVQRFQKKYGYVLAYEWDSEKNQDSDKTVEVPVVWLYNDAPAYNSDTKKTEVTIYGRMNAEDSNGYARFKFMKGAEVEAVATVSDEGEVTKNVITASKTDAVPGDKVTFTAKAEAEPADARLSYQWCKDGTPISGATSATYTFTVPESEAITDYKFTCRVTATRNNTTSPVLESNTVNLHVARDFSIEVSVDDSKAAYTVGETPKITATVYDLRSGGKKVVSNPGSMSWELLDAGTEKALSNNIATISGNSGSATMTTKATGKTDGQKITVQVTVKLEGYTYTAKKDITLSTASAGSIKMSVGDGTTIKATTVQSKAKDAVKNSSNVGLSYVKFGSPKNCSLTKSASSSSNIGSTACYFSTSSSQKLSDVYVKLDKNASSGSVTYTVYDSNDNAVVSGSITFDGEASEGSITCLGIGLDDADAADVIANEFPDAAYVEFEELAAKYGRLLLGYKGIVEIEKAKDVKDSDEYYLKGSSSQDEIEDLYLLPRTDYYGTITLDYTAYSSNGKSLGKSKLTFNVARKTSSSKFSDVTSANVGSWAADAIDFMAGNGLVGGTGNKKFSPTGTMTRCDLVLVMYRMAGEPSVNDVTNPFTDVKQGDYFYKAVLWAYKNGVVNGTGANTFSPKKNITREQIASILYRYSGAKTASGNISGFSDSSRVSDYATVAMKWAVGAGIIGGSNNKLDPQGNATRAQVAVMLHRFLNK